MSTGADRPGRSLDELTQGQLALEELVDRAALGEMATSFFELFRLSLRIISESGALLADASEHPELYVYLESLKRSRNAIQDVVAEVRRLNPGPKKHLTHTCVTGAVYRVVGLSYDGRQIGRVILGPYLPSTTRELPASLLQLDPDIDVARAKTLIAQMPCVREETVTQIARYLTKSLDLILFSGHRALLTSNMHLASVQESFRDLEEKNVRLQRAYDRLKELDRLKSNFLATVSHELRTPLTSIIGYSEMLAEGIAGELSDEQRDFVRTIHRKGEQLLQLIKGLLDLSKLESGTMSLSKAYVVVPPLIADVRQTVAPLAQKGGVRVEIDVDPALPELWADGARLRQVLLNLSENAIKFTPKGGTVTLGARLAHMESKSDDNAGFVLMARRAAVVFSVADTGIGIPEPERERVFDAFYQVDSSSTRAQGGTGLGLSIVKRLVDAHDGSVTVGENHPRGTVFVVSIPCRRATVA